MRCLWAHFMTTPVVHSFRKSPQITQITWVVISLRLVRVGSRKPQREAGSRRRSVYHTVVNEISSLRVYSSSERWAVGSYKKLGLT